MKIRVLNGVVSVRTPTSLRPHNSSPSICSSDSSPALFDSCHARYGSTEIMSTEDTALPVWYIAPISERDKSGYLWLAGILSLVYVVSFTLLRLWSNRAQLVLDDWISTLATVFGIAQCCCLFVAVSAGIGRPATSPASRHRADKAVFATILFFSMAHGIAKLSMALLSRKLFGMHKETLCNASLGLISVGGIAFLLLLLPGWNLSCPDTIIFTTECTPHYGRWYAAAGLDFLTECILFFIPASCLWDLRVAIPGKIGAISAFGARFLAIVPMFLNAWFIDQSQKNTAHDLMDNARPLMMIHTAMAVALVTTNTSALSSLARPIKAIYCGPDFNDSRLSRRRHSQMHLPGQVKHGGHRRDNTSQQNLTLEHGRL
ncbi:hypothetical protein K461DRAFT_283162, partial [Myriangium duriaei CBS 260.36]